MSGQRKRYRQQVIDQVLAKKISVPEGRARLAWFKTGRYQPARRAPAVTKSDRSQVNKQHQAVFDAGPAAMAAWHARQVLRVADAESRNPNLRENIRAGKGAV